MIISHVKPVAWVDTEEAGVIQPSHVAALSHFVELEPEDIALLTGPAGPQGVPGAKGDRGDVGPAGADGAQGVAGAPGLAGPQGLKGDKGDAGAAGVAGSQGVPGAKGDRGDVGPQGVPGVEGPQGNDGYRGVVLSMGDAVLPGFYRVMVPVDKPVGSHDYGQIFVAQGEDTVAQIYVDYITGEMYSRGGFWSEGAWVWSPWVMAGGGGASVPQAGGVGSYAILFQGSSSVLVAGGDRVSGTLYFSTPGASAKGLVPAGQKWRNMSGYDMPQGAIGLCVRVS